MEYDSHFFKFKLYIFFLLIFLNNFKEIKTANCNENTNMGNNECYTDILKFDNNRWRAGHSALNKNGDFIIEFSPDAEDTARLFYGLKPNGRYYFPNDSPTKEINLPKDYYNGKNVYPRYESINAFVALKDDTERNKEYFLSMSTYHCYLELYDFTKEEVNYKAIYSHYFLDNHIYSFKFDIFGTKISGEMIYYLVFSPSYEDKESGDRISVKKIGFSDFNFNKNTDILQTNVMGDKKHNERVTTSFLIDDIDNDDYKILVAIFIMSTSNRRYHFNVYSLIDLSLKCEKKQLYSDELETHGVDDGDGVYNKFIYLGNRDVAHIYFLSNYDNKHAYLQVLTINKDANDYSFSNKIWYDINYGLRTDILKNDVIKLADKRLVFISTNNDNELFILVIDFYNDNYNAEMRRYKFSVSPYKFTKELSAHVYNDYLAISATLENPGFFSIFLYLDLEMEQTSQLIYLHILWTQINMMLEII